jgi:hypothetical protein
VLRIQTILERIQSRPLKKLDPDPYPTPEKNVEPDPDAAPCKLFVTNIFLLFKLACKTNRFLGTEK